MKLKIYFENEQNTVNIHYARKMLIRETVLETLAYEGMENDTEVSVTFVDDKGIKELNNKFRKVGKKLLTFFGVGVKNKRLEYDFI